MACVVFGVQASAQSSVSGSVGGSGQSVDDYILELDHGATAASFSITLTVNNMASDELECNIVATQHAVANDLPFIVNSTPQPEINTTVFAGEDIAANSMGTVSYTTPSTTGMQTYLVSVSTEGTAAASYTFNVSSTDYTGTLALVSSTLLEAVTNDLDYTAGAGYVVMETVDNATSSPTELDIVTTINTNGVSGSMAFQVNTFALGSQTFTTQVFWNGTQMANVVASGSATSSSTDTFTVTPSGTLRVRYSTSSGSLITANPLAIVLWTPDQNISTLTLCTPPSAGGGSKSDDGGCAIGSSESQRGVWLALVLALGAGSLVMRKRDARV